MPNNQSNSPSDSVSTAQTVFRVLLGANLLLAGIGHLTWARTEFVAQVPHWMPLGADLVVVLSGLVEILLGASLLLLVKHKALVGSVVALFFRTRFSWEYLSVREQRGCFRPRLRHHQGDSAALPTSAGRVGSVVDRSLDCMEVTAILGRIEEPTLS